MSKPVPKFIAQRYVGGARGFRREKRAQLRQIEHRLQDLRLGCAYFPSGTKHVEEIKRAVIALKADLSRGNWGQ